jgi:hypothetical protein
MLQARLIKTLIASAFFGKIFISKESKSWLSLTILNSTKLALTSIITRLTHGKSPKAVTSY